MYDFSQEMGRVEQGLDTEMGPNIYKIHADTNSYLLLSFAPCLAPVPKRE